MFPNVTVGTVRVGGLTRPQLRTELGRWLEAIGAAPDGSLASLTLRLRDPETGQSWDARGSDLRLAIGPGKTLAKAFAAGRSGSGFLAVGGLVSCAVRGAWVAPEVTFDRDELARLFSEVASTVDVTPGNVSLDPRSGAVREGRPGRLLDPAASRRLLLAAVERLDGKGPLEVPLAISVVAPRGSADRLASLDRDRLATFATSFDTGEAGRAWNIRLSAALLDGAVIEPGGVLSFNAAVGPRTPERGFREAPEIVDNELVTGFGGGVCQVATTVFAAALLADLDVVERYHHSRPLAYIGLGRDATVSYPALDLAMRNPKAFPVILSAWVHDGRVEVSLWGRKTVATEIRLSTEELNFRPAETVLELDAKLPHGARQTVIAPFVGRDVRLWREVVQAGRVVRRELLSVDHYEPIAGLVRVGLPVAESRSDRAAREDRGEERLRKRLGDRDMP